MEQRNIRPFWTDETLTWYLEAADRCSYHRELAGRISPWLLPGGTVCDMGCGPGCLTLALLERGCRMTAVDCDRLALDCLEARSRGLKGLTVLEEDALALPPEQVWDDLVLSFFGHLTGEGMLDYFLNHCRHRLISVVNAGSATSFSSTGVSARNRVYAPQVAAFLDRRGLRYRMKSCTLEFGQPLMDLDDARSFVRRHSPPGSPPPEDGWLRDHLRAMPDGSWYLPKAKRMGIFIIEKP